MAFDQPFFATLMAMTDFIEDRSRPTIATDGLNIYYNPIFLDPLTQAQLYGVLMHELLHIVYLHCSKDRQRERDGFLWNVAGDFAINQELNSWGFKLPKGGLLSSEFTGMTTEGIYEKVLDHQSSKCSCKEGSGGIPHLDRSGKHLHPMDEVLPMTGEGLEEAVGRIFTAEAHAPGSVPRKIARWLKQLRESRVPWERLLKRFLNSAVVREHQTFTPPNRRHIWDERYMPSIRTTGRGRIVVVVDTSGSIDPEQLTSFAGEIAGLTALVSSLTVITCDAKVHETVEIKNAEELLRQIAFSGGGGTDFVPAFNMIGKFASKPDAVIYLTDGYGRFPEKAPRDFPVLWCLTEPVAVPWGTKVFLPRETVKQRV